MHYRLPLPIALIGAFFLSQITVSSQETDEEVFNLDAFRVTTSQDRGYAATNSVSGTLLDTPLKNTPFAIDVTTLEFIQDTGSTDFREALAYDSGVMLDNTLERSDGSNFTTGVENDDRAIRNNDTDIVVRGFRAPTLKNGFFTQTRVDTINIGRMENASGPVSLLYGVGAISGITNVLTATPLTEPRYRVEAFAGSQNFRRAAIDATGPIMRDFGKDGRGSLLYRFTAAWQTEDRLFDFGTEESSFFSPVIEWRPDAKTRLVFEMEYGTRDRTGVGTRDIDDNRVSFLTDEDERGQLLEDTLGLGRFVNISGPDATSEEKVVSTRVELTRVINDEFTLLAAVSHDDYQQEEFRPEQVTHFRVSGRDPVPPEFVIDRYSVGYSWGNPENTRASLQSRVSLLYSKELFGGIQNLVIGRQDRSQKADNDATNPNAARTSFLAPDGGIIHYAGEDTVLPRALLKDEQWYTGYYAIFQGSFWNDRILPVLGYRWDKTQTRLRQFLYQPDGSLVWDENFLTNRGIIGGYDDVVRQRSPTSGLSIILNDQFTLYGTYSEGTALANTPQRDGLGKAFAPPSMRGRELGLKFALLEGRVSGRLTYFNMDKRGGVRYSFYVPNPSRGNFDPSQPIYYTLTSQQAQAFATFVGKPLDESGIREEFNQQTGRSELNAYWDDLGPQLLAFNEQERIKNLNGEPNNGIAFNGGNNPSEDRGAYHLFDENSTGWEFRLNLNLTDNWSTVFSYTMAEVLITSGISGLYDDPNGLNTGLHPVFWVLGPENFTDPTRPSTYSGNIGAGTLNNDTPKHAATLWTKYSFKEGPLAGLDLRAGVRYSGERLAESPWEGALDAIQRGQGVEFTKAPVPAVTLVDIGAGYTREFRGVEYNLSVNVRNLLDDVLFEADAPVRTVLTPDGRIPVKTRYYAEPREVRVSLRANF